MVTATPKSGIVETAEQRREELYDCLAYFTELKKERMQRKEANDFLTMLSQHADTRDMHPQEFLGNLLLLIVGPLRYIRV